MRLNRTLPTLALAIMAASLPAKGAIISLSSPSAVTIGNAVEIDLSIDLDPGETLYAYQVNINFPLFLQADSVTELGYFAANGVGATPTIDNTGRVVSVFSSLSGSDILSSDDSLFRITFSTLATGSGLAEIDPSLLILLDGSFSDVTVNGLTPASVEVNAVPEPATILGVAAGLAAVAMARSRRRRQLFLEPAARE
jgi:hypothetical protein